MMLLLVMLLPLRAPRCRSPPLAATPSIANVCFSSSDLLSLELKGPHLSGDQERRTHAMNTQKPRLKARELRVCSIWFLGNERRRRQALELKRPTRVCSLKRQRSNNRLDHIIIF